MTHISTVVALLCLAPLGNAAAATLYRCTGADRIPTYVSKPVEGQECVTISRYTPAAPIPGKDWKLVSSLATTDIYFLDRSPKGSGRGSAVWVMYDYRVKQPWKDGIDEHQSSIERWSLDCHERTMGTTQRSYYSEALGTGEVVNNWQAIQKPLMSYAIPNSIGELVLDAACTVSKKGT